MRVDAAAGSAKPAEQDLPCRTSRCENFLYDLSRPALRAAAFGGRPRPATPTFRSWASSGLPKGQPVRARLNG
jgi:hypothetical protein